MVATQRRKQPDERRDHPTSPALTARLWEIRDKILPEVLTGNHDQFESWPNGDCRRAYDSASCADAARHWTGWAMRNTNNHNHIVLKKSCIGLLVCSRRSTTGCDVRLRPAICSKAREKQLEAACPRSGCDGQLTIQKCSGNRGFPVTHFWRTEGSTTYFEAKGYHDHPAPDQRWTRTGFVSATPAVRTTPQKCRKRNADVTSETSSTSSNNEAPEVETFDFRSAATTQWTAGADSPFVSSTGSYGDDVTWHVVESSSPDIPHPVNKSLRRSSPAEWWQTASLAYPWPDQEPLSKMLQPKAETFDFQSPDMMGRTDEADTSILSTGSSVDDVTKPEVSVSFESDTPYPVNKSPSQLDVAAYWQKGFMTYPSPDPVAEIESTPRSRAPFSIHSQWLAPGAHDQWIDSSYSTTHEDSRPYSIYHNSDKLYDSDFILQQPQFGSYLDQSLSGVIFQSMEGTNRGCWQFDSDYIDDVLSVMAKAANNCHPVYGFA